jgi:endonuclease III
VGETLSIVHALHEFYGPVHRPPSTLFQFVVWEVLSEHGLPARRDLAWNALRKIPALTPDAMFRAPASELGDAVALTGAARDEVLGRLRALVDLFKRHRDTLDDAALQHASPIAASRALAVLTPLDSGVLRRALLFALGMPVIPVDDEISRVVQRLSQPLTAAHAPGTPAPVPAAARARRRVRRWLASQLPRDVEAYRDTVMWLRHHARHTCLAAGPHCHVCPLRHDCRTGAAAVS